MPGALEGRVALVTGASRGIGAAAARALAREGAHVVAVARTAGSLDELARDVPELTALPLDVADAAAIGSLATTIDQRFGRLDVLLGNAGILGPVANVPELPLADWQQVLTINVTANFLLLHTLDPLLRRSDAGRAVFMSSSVVGIARPGSAAYAASKAALELLVRTYANETAGTRIRANLFNPGPTRTAMHRARHPQVDPMTVDTPEQVAQMIVPLCLPSFEETGRIYDYRYKALLAYRPPGPPNPQP